MTDTPSSHDPSDRGGSPSASLLRLLLATTATLAGLSLALAAVLMVRTRAPVDATQLSAEQRASLVQSILADSPGAHQWAYFEPRVGYTLRPNQDLDAWGATFHSNELGYRSPPARKGKGTFRVVFVGDSWTFGMGLPYEDSFPAVLQRLAAESGAGSGRVETWTLALPGYNLLQALAALELFLPRLEPDAVVVVPSSNDHQSSGVVLPNGSLWRDAILADEFGSPHVTTHREPFLGSYEVDRRWRVTMDRLREVQSTLQARGVPLVTFFLARWPQPAAHAMMHQAGLEGPYAVVDRSFTVGEWLNPPPQEHGNAAANRLYAELVYALLAPVLGWPARPAEDAERVGELFARVPPAETWTVGWQRVREGANRDVPEHLTRTSLGPAAAAGPIDFTTGAIGRATTLLLRRRADATRLRLVLQRLDAPSLYPQTVTVSAPSRSGGTRTAVVVEPHREEFAIELALPDDIPPGDVIDLLIEAERAVVQPGDRLRGRSLAVVEVAQLAR